VTVEIITIHREPRRGVPANASLGDAPSGDERGSGDDRRGFADPVAPGAPGDPGESGLLDSPERGGEDSRSLVPSPGGATDAPTPPTSPAPGDPQTSEPGAPPSRRRLRKTNDRSVGDPGGDAPGSGSPTDPRKHAPRAPGGDTPPSVPRKQAPSLGNEAPTSPHKQAPSKGPTETPKKTRPSTQ
jgi:hypothetical protein